MDFERYVSKNTKRKNKPENNDNNKQIYIYIRVVGKMCFVRMNFLGTYSCQKKSEDGKNRDQHTFKKIYEIVLKKNFSQPPELHTLQRVSRV